MISVLDYIVFLEEKGKLGSLFAIERYKKICPSIFVFGNTELKNIKFIKAQVKEAGGKFKHLSHKTKLDSSSRLAKLILDNFSS